MSQLMNPNMQKTGIRPPAVSSNTAGGTLVTISLSILAGVGLWLAAEKYLFGVTAPTDAQLIATLNMQSGRIARLESEIAGLKQHDTTLQEELAALIDPGGVLPQLVSRLRDQRRINASNAGALQQLFGITNTLNSTQDVFAETPEAPIHGSRPVQVTPVRSTVINEPARVVVTPDQVNE
jgi:hypothetical protein